MLMMGTFKKKSYSIIKNLAIFLFWCFVFPSRAFAGICTDTKTFKCLEYIYERVLQNAMGLIMIIMFLMVVSGGIKWLTSSGEPKDIENAKGRITFAIIGLAVIILAWFILKFLSDFLTVPNLLQFTIQ